MLFTLSTKIPVLEVLNSCLIAAPAVSQHTYQSVVQISLTAWLMFPFEVLFLSNLACGTVLCFQTCFGSSQTFHFLPLMEPLWDAPGMLV